MRTKSLDLALIVPVITAAALLNSTERSLRRSATESELDEHMQLVVMGLADLIRDALTKLDQFRALYDRSLTS